MYSLLTRWQQGTKRTPEMPDEDFKEISAILSSYHYGTLYQMADAAGLRVNDGQGKKLRKAELLPIMRAEYFSEARVHASWEGLARRERDVLNRLLLHGGEATTRVFQREIIRTRLATKAPEPQRPKTPYQYYRSSTSYADGYAGNPDHRDSPIFEDIIARLTYHGLVFSRGTPLTSGGTPHKIQFHPGTTLYVPQVIRRTLPEPEPIQIRDSIWQPARVETGTPALLLRDLYLYWDFVRRNQVALIQAGFVGKRSLKAINDVLIVPDPLLQEARREDRTEWLYLLRQLLERLDLVHKVDGQLRPTGDDALHIPAFWSRSPIEQLGACLEAWPQLEELGGLEDDAAKYSPHYAHARQAVLRALKTLPSNMWLESEDLLDQILAQDVDFLSPEHSRIQNKRGSWYYSSSGSHLYGQPEELLHSLESLEIAFVNHCLTGFLHQLGAVELGYNGNALVGFRLTPAGGIMSGLEPSTQSPQDGLHAEEGKLIAQPTFELLAMGPVSLALLARLDLFADRQRADQGAFEYRLTQESVYRAQQLGMEVADATRFLERASDTELPQNVRRSLEEWAAQHERIVFRTGVSLLQAADADLLAELMHGPHTGLHLARSVSPEVALVREGQQQSLISTLVGQGLLPAVSAARPEAADNSVIIQGDGAIRPIHAVPSLHLRGRLSRLAEKAANGEWQLTSASVRRAGGSKREVLLLLEELGRLQRGPFPSTVVEWVKSRGSYYGDADTETITLIEFRDQDTLKELRGQPELHPYLTPFPAGDRALAIVVTEKLSTVKEILDRFGVRVKHGLQR